MLNLPTFSYSVSNLPKSARNGTMDIIFSYYMKACIEPSVFHNQSCYCLVTRNAFLSCYYDKIVGIVHLTSEDF